jgi:hypothetical protein
MPWLGLVPDLSRKRSICWAAHPAFRQTGAQSLAGEVSTGIFCLIVPLKFRKDIFANFHNVAHPGRLASHLIISSRLVWRGLSSDSLPGPAGAWAASEARSTTTHAWPPAHPHPSTVFFSPACGFGGPFAVQ